MPIRFISPLVKTFTLDKADARYGTDGTPTEVTICQATQSQHERRSALFADITQIIDRTDEVKQKWRWSFEELKRMEVFLTLVGCNIPGELGGTLFRFRNNGTEQILDMTETEFIRAWGLLPPDVAQEIHEKVMEVNMEWAGPLA